MSAAQPRDGVPAPDSERVHASLLPAYSQHTSRRFNGLPACCWAIAAVAATIAATIAFAPKRSPAHISQNSSTSDAGLAVWLHHAPVRDEAAAMRAPARTVPRGAAHPLKVQGVLGKTTDAGSQSVRDRTPRSLRESAAEVRGVTIDVLHARTPPPSVVRRGARVAPISDAP